MPTSKRSKNLKVILLSLLVLVLVPFSFSTVLAESINGSNVVVESDQTLNKTSFLSGTNVRVDGDINRTTFVAAGDVEVNGTIDGDLFVAAQSVTINGTVKGSIFTASQNITVNGYTENNIYSAGATINVDSQTDGSAFLAGKDIYIKDEATIKNDVFVGAANVNQDGLINGDLSSSSESLSIDGVIDGDLNYSSPNKADFSSASEIAGKTNWDKTESESSKPMSSVSILLTVLFSILASLVIWLAVRLIRPIFWTNVANKILTTPLEAGGFGVLALMVIPIISMLLMFTVIGIPLSLILLVLYGISIYISKIILAVFIGLWFQNKFNWSSLQAFWMFLLGLIILSVIGFVPIIGWISRFIIISLGLGSIILSIKTKKEAHISMTSKD